MINFESFKSKILYPLRGGSKGEAFESFASERVAFDLVPPRRGEGPLQEHKINVNHESYLF